MTVLRFRKTGPSVGPEKRLIDEFKIRAQVAGIEASPQPPIRKARLILRLARRIRSAAASLAALSQRSFRDGDTLRGARMREATQRLIATHEEVRAHAGAALAEGRPQERRPVSEERPHKKEPRRTAVKVR